MDVAAATNFKFDVLPQLLQNCDRKDIFKFNTDETDLYFKGLLLILDRGYALSIETLSGGKRAKELGTVLPMDMGDIRNMKGHYKKKAYDRIAELDADDTKRAADAIKNIYLLNAIYMLIETWSEIKLETIVNCYAVAKADAEIAHEVKRRDRHISEFEAEEEDNPATKQKGIARGYQHNEDIPSEQRETLSFPHFKTKAIETEILQSLREKCMQKFITFESATAANRYPLKYQGQVVQTNSAIHRRGRLRSRKPCLLNDASRVQTNESQRVRGLDCGQDDEEFPNRSAAAIAV
ncbi:hypothetical protein ElyMa_004917900 [Elysia marginata]|uniref:DDE-1 domain-containing protein n=1 Tax=Elysia marginata TaxID=1093978 RepID=A0AAV4IWW4_9GAST|nr:hypothetical protein ElyMa_004917900 [Elysia marginata]